MYSAKKFLDHFERSYRIVLAAYCASNATIFAVAWVVSPFCHSRPDICLGTVGFFLVAMFASVVGAGNKLFRSPERTGWVGWQINDRVKRKWPVVAIVFPTAFPFLTAITLAQLLSLETGQVTSMRMWSLLVDIYNWAGFWPTVLTVPVGGFVLLLTLLLNIRRAVGPSGKVIPEDQAEIEREIQAERKIHRVGNMFELLILWLGLGAGVYFTAPRAWHELQEKQPTQIDMDHWQQDYHGQHWLEVTGTFLPELAAYKDYQGDAKPGCRECLVPFVASDYHNGDEIQVIVSIGAVADSAKDEISRRQIHGRTTVRGLLFGPFRSDRMFPNLKVAESAVYLHEGSQPSPWGNLIFAICCMAGMIFCTTVLAMAWRRRRAGRSAQATQTNPYEHKAV